MCKPGDIILINNYQRDGQAIGRHSFVVINDESGNIQGLDYDIICNVMSSIKSEEHKIKKLSYPGNFPIEYGDSFVFGRDGTPGYIKSEQFFYFNKDLIKFTVIGSMSKEAFDDLIDFINTLDIDFEHIIDNL